jgi:hypothetical protein
MRALLPQTQRRHAISRYFFHVFDVQDLPDLVGTEQPDDAAAKAEAIVTAGTMLSEVGSRFWDGEKWAMRVENDAGTLVCELRVSANSRNLT